MQKYFPVEEYFTTAIIVELKELINNYGGDEMVFAANVNTKGKIADYNILSRGNQHAAPVQYSEASRYDVLIHNHPSGVLRPSDADLQVAQTLSDHSTAFYIIDNEVSQLNIVTSLMVKSQVYPLDQDDVLQYFTASPKVLKLFPDFESRSSQVRMVEKIIEAFNEEKVFLCEASTGTGKSLAYLIPSILWAVENQQKIIISTNTINLQEQLIQKDIPMACKITGQDVPFAMVKGRNNYLCLRKLGQVMSSWKSESNSLLFENDKEKEKLIKWGKQTQNGDKAELDFIPSYHLWDQIASEGDTCQKSRCPHKEKCFYQKARRKIFSSTILVVNHHILCADLSIKKETENFKSQALLPQYERVIIDEAHNLEAVATEYFGKSASNGAIIRNLNLIGNVEEDKLKKGLLSSFKKDLRQVGVDSKSEEYQQLDRFLRDYLQWRREYQKAFPELIEKIHNYLTEVDSSPYTEKKMRLKNEILTLPEWEKGYRNPVNILCASLGELAIILKKILLLIKKMKLSDEFNQKRVDLEAYYFRIEELKDILLESLKKIDEEEIKWISSNKQISSLTKKERVNFSTHISPLNIGEALREALFEPYKSIILTSATMTATKGNKTNFSDKTETLAKKKSAKKIQNFEFLKNNLGLSDFPPERLIEEQLPANFDYFKNCLFYLPDKIPAPHHSNFNEKAAEFILEMILLLKGRVLVLCTSYSQMELLTTALTIVLENEGIEILVQGEKQNSILLEKLSRDSRSVLFGVASMWEGVDIKGEALKCVIMIKLPFAVPSEPMTQAKMEFLEKQGKNSFTDFSIPLALIRFKQGFGRLIRSQSDKGIFMVLDNRLIHKFYGRYFFDVLPQMHKTHHFEQVKAFLKQK